MGEEGGGSGKVGRDKEKEEERRDGEKRRYVCLKEKGRERKGERENLIRESYK